MRDANDRGYECLVLSDCTGATDYANHVAALNMVTMQGGVFGAHATSAALLEAFDAIRGRSASTPEPVSADEVSLGPWPYQKKSANSF
jgi:hypothetical protein